MKFKSSKARLFEMVEKINHVKPVLNEEYKIMGSYEGMSARLIETAQDPYQAKVLKNEAQLSYGEGFTAWIEHGGKVINESMIDAEPMSLPPVHKTFAPRLKQGIEEELGEKYRAEVTGKGENVWSTNAMEYNTEQEAKDWLNGLANRWFGYDMGRVVPVSTPKGQPVDMENDNIYQNFRR